MVKGLSNLHAARILAAREAPFASIEDVWRRSGVPAAALEKLADADAFHSLGLDRRQALWQVRARRAPLAFVRRRRCARGRPRAGGGA
jgi:error-prone DNA polymerase